MYNKKDSTLGLSVRYIIPFHPFLRSHQGSGQSRGQRRAGRSCRFGVTFVVGLSGRRERCFAFSGVSQIIIIWGLKQFLQFFPLIDWQ